ncbi:MAG: peptidase [Acidobacteriales bacterium]|nr:peptidase [Terriglobales bacterium]
MKIKRGIALRLTIFLVVLTVLATMVTQPMFLFKKSQFTSRANPDRLKAHVEMLAGKIPNRSYDDPRNLNRAADYITAEFKKSGASVSEQPVRAGGRQFKNIIADFGPDSPEMIVVGAHYDSYGGYPGADDNASGTAGLIELAQLLSNTKLPMKVELVAYTLEEPPFFRSPSQGSLVHASSLKKINAKVRAMICLEMIGFFSDKAGSQSYPVPGMGLIYPDRANYIAVVGSFAHFGLVRTVKKAMTAGSDLPVRSTNAPRSIPGIDFSDHASYWDMGYPAVMITDTAFYRNPNYHTAQDTPDTLDYNRMAKVVDQVYGAVLALAK